MDSLSSEVLSEDAVRSDAKVVASAVGDEPQSLGGPTFEEISDDDADDMNVPVPPFPGSCELDEGERMHGNQTSADSVHA